MAGNPLLVGDEQPAEHRDDDGDDRKDDICHVDTQGLEHHDHGCGCREGSDVSDQEQDTAHCGELALPEPHGQDLHDRDIDYRGTDSDDELRYHEECEVQNAGHGGVGPEERSDRDQEHEDRGGLLGSEGIC